MQYARGNSSSQNLDGKRLQDILQTTSNIDEQQKVKIAFAEGENLISIKTFLIRKDFL